MIDRGGSGLYQAYRRSIAGATLRKRILALLIDGLS